ncbi:uncharacterized protein LOC108911331 [Anoplophora glabripennis]|nr:uncharacterized protein LOC108911331 [Anoplophora glabripennis]
MKALLLLFCYLLFISNSPVLGQSGCTIEGISSSFLILSVSDTQINTNLLTGKYENENLVLGTCTSDNSYGLSYFSVTANGTHFLIDSTEEFGDFDKNTDKTTSSIIIVNLECPLSCTSDSTQTIQFQVRDTNNHEPEFSKSSYELKVPSPIMPMTDITVYGDSIVATDIDFSNQDVTFTIEPDDFSITTQSTSTSKNYTAVFSTRNVIQLTDTQEYTITATDSGAPALSASVKLTISVDESLSLDSPSFEQPFYSFNYSVTNEIPLLTANDGSITLVTIKPDSVSTPTLTGIFTEYEGYFKTEFDATTRTISFAVTDPLPTTSESVLILTLSVTTDSSASTSIIIYLSADSTGAPQFSNHYYTGSYDDVTGDVEHDVITIASSGTPNVTISGEYADHFSVKYDNTDKSCKISVDTSLSVSELKDNSYITLTIEATVDDYSDTAALIIALPEHILQFTETLYSASYSTDHVVTIDSDHPIGFTTDVTGVNIAVADTYSKNFEVKLDSDSKQYVISVVDHLSDEVLKKQKEIVLTLTATDAYENEAQAVINVQLPETATDAPNFSETVYMAKYTDASLTIEKDIAFSNRDDPALITIKLDSYTEYFGISYTEDKWVFKVLKALPTKILTSNKEIAITLTASEENNDATGHSVLVINWDTKDAPLFSEEYYSGSYPESGKGNITLTTDIGFTNVENPKNVEVQLNSYDEYFAVKYDSGKWDLSILKSLDDATLSKNSQLIIVLTAIETDNTKNGHSVLVLQLPSNAIQFAEAYYVAEYPKSGSGTIEFENPIELVNAKDPTKVTITLDNYKDNFEIKYDANKWTINIISALDDATLKANTELVITLTASEAGKENTGHAVLVLKLPVEVVPEFSAAYYTANYPADGSGTIEFEPSLEISNIDNPEDIAITLDNYEANFDITYDNNKWVINIKNSLDDAILKASPELVMTLIATQEGKESTAHAVVVLKLPAEVIPKFSQAYYTAEYPKDGVGTIEFEPSLEFSNIDNPENVIITLEKYSEKFEIKFESNKWSIGVIKALDDDIILNRSEILMTLSASTSSNTDKGEATLVMNLPRDSYNEAPTFSMAYYTTIFIMLLYFLFSLLLCLYLKDYNDNFGITYVANKWIINIIKALDDATLKTNSELVMTLTATEAGKENTGQAVLVLKLPAEVVPEFSEAYYTAYYPEDVTQVMEFEPSIEFSNIDDPKGVVITLDNYADNFEIKYDTNKWVVNIKTALNDSTLKTNSELVMTLTASEKDKENTAEAVLVLKLPTKIVPKFSEAYYTANYPKYGDGTIEFEPSLEFSNIDTPEDIVIALDKYTENFAIDFASGKWHISIIKTLDDDIILKNTELLMTLTASASGNTDKGEATLVMNLPRDSYIEAPTFSKAYYTAQYPEKGSGVIEFENPIEFTNVKDATTITITLDNYKDNFEIQYETNKWVINIKNSLDHAILKANSELVMTLAATEVGNESIGQAVLILNLPAELAPKFSEVYYTADYPEDGTGTIDFKPSLGFSNVDDPKDVVIALDQYTENFELIYDSNRWYIKITKCLDDETLLNNQELVLTLTASASGISDTGETILVMNLPRNKGEEAPEFSKAYYIAQYPQKGSGVIAFEDPIEFTNVNEMSTVTITLDNYADYLEIIYDSDKWALNIKKSLDDATLNSNSELTMTLIASQAEKDVTGEAALVLKLPKVETKTGPKFSKAYYTADYPENGVGSIEFNPSLEFSNVDDPTDVVIALDKYTENFELIYDSNKWYIKITKSLDDDTLLNNEELILKLTASASGISDTGETVLVMNLPSIKDEAAPEFSKAYYIAQYSEENSGIVAFEDPITFTNVNDEKTVTITLDNYVDYLEIIYDTDKWVLKIKKPLDETTLYTNSELTMTLIASQVDKDVIGEAALVLKLPKKDTETEPKFSKAYYTADYPENGTGTIEFKPSLEFSNIDDPTEVVIALDNYADNFEIKYDNDKWVINIKKGLDDAILKAHSELVITLTASQSGTEDTGETALVLELPKVNSEAGPKFSKAYYTADYPEDSVGTIDFKPSLEFSNVDNPEDIIITLDNYADNFEIKYDNDKWVINIKKGLDDAILKAHSELVITLTASQSGTEDTGETALVLELPKVNSEAGPKFSKAYYTADYPEDSVGTIDFKPSLEFSNVDNPEDIIITLDNYADNFEIKYDNDKWVINIKKGLDDAILKAHSELVITLTASQSGTEDTGETALVLELPKVNSEAGPKFSKAYYTADYPEDSVGTIDFKPSLEFSNVDNPEDIIITLDNYADNFEIKYDNDKWVINIKKGLDDAILKAKSELVITLIASQTGTEDTGETALVLKLPTVNTEAGPKFSKAYYSADYPEDGVGTIDFKPSIELSNIDNPEDVAIALDSYTTNFEVKYSDRWYINILESLTDSVLQENTELVITLAATEDGSETAGESVLVLQLPSTEETSSLKFEKSFYVATYPETGSGLIDFEPSIVLDNIDDPTEVSISLDTYAENFEVKYDSGKWYINIKQSLENSVLTDNEELLMTLTAKNTNSGNEGKCALVMQLPIPADGRALRFSEPYYLANYPEDGKANIEFEIPIEFLNSEDKSDIQIQLDNYGDYFEIKQDESKWYIQIKKSLDETVLQKNTELVMALIATESENSYKAESALVIKLPTGTDSTSLSFSAAYYLAEYPEKGTAVIEFLSPLEISNVDDQNGVTISLDTTYAAYFEILYDSDRWYIKILKSLEDSLLHKDPEIVITLTATESESEGVNPGTSALVLRLPTASNDDTLIFSDAYYTAEYVEDDTKIIEFENPIKITNVEDQSSVTITLDKNSENFEVKYGDGKWYIHVKSVLDDDVKEKTELLITLTATDPDFKNEGYSALVLKLPSQENTIGPQFSNAFYLADYPEKGSGSVDFGEPIEFSNVDDLSTLNIALDNYVSNFDVVYDTAKSKWYLNIKNALDDTTLQTETELVITMTATDGSGKKGSSALVIKLPSAAVETGLEFSEVYYLADYPESGTGELKFENTISFENVDDPSSVTITFDNYGDNFAANYDDSWHVTIEKGLDDAILQKNTEIVITLTASANGKEARSALVIKLPSSTDNLAPEFSDAYYLAKYTDNGVKTVEFENEISFTNIDDPSTIDISLDNYEEYFKVSYTSEKWILNIQKSLGDEILSKNKELVMTMTASETDNDIKGYSALVIELPTTDSESGPVFSEAYYLADYPEKYTGVIEFNTPIAFDNVEDSSKLTIKLDNFTDHFEIKLENERWIIKVKQVLDSSVLTSAFELVMTLTATESDTGKEGYSALVLRLPENDVAPIFSKTYYTANYVSTGSETNVVFSTPITITNQDDIAGITLSIDNYGDYFSIEYDSESESWVVKVTKQLPNDILTQKTDIVVALTATNPQNSLTDHAAIDLALPSLNTDNAPKFSQTYYTAIYKISDGKATVAFDSSVIITNRENLDAISIGLDNYSNNFEMTYDETSGSWQMTVKNNLDQTTLNRKIDLVMALTATESDNDEYGQAVLLIRLPVANTDDAPKFSSIYYDGIYTVGDEPSVTLEDIIAITNKEDLTAITIAFDDSYKNYLEVVYDTSSSQFKLNVKSPLSDDAFKDSSDLILTLTATETGSSAFSQAALVLHLPLEEVKLAPEFGQPHYIAQYVEEDSKVKIVLDETITVTNKADLEKIQVALDSYQSNFEVKVTSTNEWDISVINPLESDIISSTRELVLTLTATEDDNINKGKSTLIISLPLANEEVITFSEVYYSASYSSNGELSMDDAVKVVITEGDIKNVATSISDGYESYFTVSYSSNEITVVLEEDIPTDVLAKNSFIPLVLTVGINGTTAQSSSVLNVEINCSVYRNYFAVSYANGELSVTLKENLPDDAVQSNSFITLTLEVSIKDTVHSSSAVLNININSVERSVSFSNPLYAGKYEVVDGSGSLQMTDKITIVTEETDDNIYVTITNSDGYESYFSVSYSSNEITVGLEKDIPNDVLAKNSFIPLVMTVGITDTPIQSSSILNVELNYEQPEGSIAFSSLLYNGKYEIVDGMGTLQTDTITLSTEEVDGNINVAITNEYDDFFSVEYSENQVIITLVKSLTDTILNSSSVVPLALKAEIEGTSVSAEAVVNIAIIYNSDDDVDSIEFGSVLYTGDYSISESKGNLELHQSIKVISTSSDDLIEPNISEGSVYRDYFDVSYANGELSVTLKGNLPDDAVESNSFITLTLEVSITDTVHSSSAVLNININRVERSVSFSNLLYVGKYEVVDGTGLLQITDSITLNTEEPDANINLTITNEYENFFSAEYSEKQVTISIKQQLSETIVDSFSVVPLTLHAEITGTSVSSEAVVNIAIIYDSEDDTDSIEFGSLLYTGEYSVSDGKGSMEVHQSIKVISTSTDDLVQPSISDAEYEEYFDVSYANGEVSVTLNKNLPDEVVNSNTFIALTLKVKIKDTIHESSAVLNININSNTNNDQGSVTFSDLLYNAKYEIIDNSPKLTFDAITIDTDPAGSDVVVTVTNEYASYFSVAYSEGTVDIEIEKALTEEILNSYSVVPLIIQAQINGESYKASAVVNIEIKYDSDGDTDSIQFTSILYSGEYTIQNGKSSFNLDDSIKISTNRPDSDIITSISEDSLYRDYFNTTYSDKAVTVDLINSLPSNAVKSNFISLTLTAEIKDTIHTSSAVLNIGIDNEDEDDNNSSDKDDEDSKTELHHMRITFIVVTAILSVLLLACIAGALAYYFLKIRSENYANLEEDGSGRVRFGKNSLSRSPSSNKSSALEERRPTGFIFHPISEDTSDSPNGTVKDRRKSVAFDDNVEKLQIDSVNDDDVDTYSSDKSQVTHV